MTKKSEAKIQFGNRVQELRKNAGYSQEELGFKSGLHRTYIGSIERGEQNVSIDNIFKIAKALNITLKELFSTFDKS